MSAQVITSTNNVQGLSTSAKNQYTLWQIFGIWALVALPMALLAWVIAPAVIPYSPLHPGLTYWVLIIAGMAVPLISSDHVSSDHVPRAWHTALECHPPAYLASNPARSKDASTESTAFLVVAACFAFFCPGDHKTCQLSGCAHDLVVSCSAASHVHGYISIGCSRVPGPMVDHGSCRGQLYFKILPGQGISLPRRTLT